MTTIDHRILIPAAPDAVWDYISDITRNPDWQIDCAEVIFLTTRREGPGLRWRSAAPSGHHETVIAVTAWYNGLGYEYYFVDGVPYRENRGRIRLQEIPEGTIVQWTFTYELGGVFGGMRNALGVRRQIDHTIAESLKTLWQKLKQTGVAAQAREAKSLMRDAPDVQARSAYQSRHGSPPTDGDKTPRFAEPTKLVKEPPIGEGDGQPIRVIAEPPIEEEDTRPRPVVEPTIKAAAAESVPADLESEPEFLRQIPDDHSRFEPPPESDLEPEFLRQIPDDLSRFEPPVDPSDTQPRKPVAPMTEAPTQNIRPPVTITGEETEPLAVPLPQNLPNYNTFILPTKPEPEQPTAPAAPREEETALDLEAAADELAPPTQPTEAPATEPSVTTSVPPVLDETESNLPQIEKPPAQEPEPPAVISTPQDQPPVFEAKPVTEHASIWEVFGVPRPSETQEMTAASPNAPKAEAKALVELEPVREVAAVTPPEKIKLTPASTHVGLRIAMRRTLVRVRRP